MRTLTAFLMSVFLMSAVAGAKCPNPHPRLLCAEYFQSDVVVTATLLKTKLISTEDDDTLFHTMRRQQVLRGRIGPIFKVIDCLCSGAAGVTTEEGHSYLLFLSYRKDRRAWVLDGCGNSDDLENADETLKRIHDLRSGGNGGTIHGSVWRNQEATVMAAGVRVQAIGRQGVFKAVTDQEGNFEIHVPAGIYRVTISGEGERFEPDIWTYEDPKRFRVSKGGCAQLQFLPLEVRQESRRKKSHPIIVPAKH
jgi:hypothetical protein